MSTVSNMHVVEFLLVMAFNVHAVVSLTCFWCSGVDNDRMCETRPRKVSSYPVAINCSTKFCVSTKVMDAVTGTVRSFARSCDHIPRGNQCVKDFHFVTCSETCTFDLCNSGNPDPSYLLTRAFSGVLLQLSEVFGVENKTPRNFNSKSFYKQLSERPVGWKYSSHVNRTLSSGNYHSKIDHEKYPSWKKHGVGTNDRQDDNINAFNSFQNSEISIYPSEKLMAATEKENSARNDTIIRSYPFSSKAEIDKVPTFSNGNKFHESINPMFRPQEIFWWEKLKDAQTDTNNVVEIIQMTNVNKVYKNNKGEIQSKNNLSREDPQVFSLLDTGDKHDTSRFVNNVSDYFPLMRENVSSVMNQVSSDDARLMKPSQKSEVFVNYARPVTNSKNINVVRWWEKSEPHPGNDQLADSTKHHSWKLPGSDVQQGEPSLEPAKSADSQLGDSMSQHLGDSVNHLGDSTSQQLRDSTSQQLRDSTSQQLRDSTSQQLGSTTSQQLGSTTSQQLGSTTSHYLRDSASQLPGHSTSQLPGHSTSQLPGHSTSQLPGHSTSQLPGHSTSQQVNLLKDSNNNQFPREISQDFVFIPENSKSEVEKGNKWHHTLIPSINATHDHGGKSSQLGSGRDDSFFSKPEMDAESGTAVTQPSEPFRASLGKLCRPPTNESLCTGNENKAMFNFTANYGFSTDYPRLLNVQTMSTSSPGARKLKAESAGNMAISLESVGNMRNRIIHESLQSVGNMTNRSVLASAGSTENMAIRFIHTSPILKENKTLLKGNTPGQDTIPTSHYSDVAVETDQDEAAGRPDPALGSRGPPSEGGLAQSIVVNPLTLHDVSTMNSVALTQELPDFSLINSVTVTQELPDLSPINSVTVTQGLPDLSPINSVTVTQELPYLFPNNSVAVTQELPDLSPNNSVTVTQELPDLSPINSVTVTQELPDISPINSVTLTQELPDLSHMTSVTLTQGLPNLSPIHSVTVTQELPDLSPINPVASAKKLPDLSPINSMTVTQELSDLSPMNSVTVTQELPDLSPISPVVSEKKLPDLSPVNPVASAKKLPDLSPIRPVASAKKLTEVSAIKDTSHKQPTHERSLTHRTDTAPINNFRKHMTASVHSNASAKTTNIHEERAQLRNDSLALPRSTERAQNITLLGTTEDQHSFTNGSSFHTDVGTKRGKMQEQYSKIINFSSTEQRSTERNQNIAQSGETDGHNLINKSPLNSRGGDERTIIYKAQTKATNLSAEQQQPLAINQDITSLGKTELSLHPGDSINLTSMHEEQANTIHFSVAQQTSSGRSQNKDSLGNTEERNIVDNEHFLHPNIRITPANVDKHQNMTKYLWISLKNQTDKIQDMESSAKTEDQSFLSNDGNTSSYDKLIDNKLSYDKQTSDESSLRKTRNDKYTNCKLSSDMPSHDKSSSYNSSNDTTSLIESGIDKSNYNTPNYDKPSDDKSHDYKSNAEISNDNKPNYIDSDIIISQTNRWLHNVNRSSEGQFLKVIDTSRVNANVSWADKENTHTQLRSKPSRIRMESKSRETETFTNSSNNMDVKISNVTTSDVTTSQNKTQLLANIETTGIKTDPTLSKVIYRNDDLQADDEQIINKTGSSETDTGRTKTDKQEADLGSRHSLTTRKDTTSRKQTIISTIEFESTVNTSILVTDQLSKNTPKENVRTNDGQREIKNKRNYYNTLEKQRELDNLKSGTRNQTAIRTSRKKTSNLTDVISETFIDGEKDNEVDTTSLARNKVAGVINKKLAKNRHLSEKKRPIHLQMQSSSRFHEDTEKPGMRARQKRPNPNYKKQNSNNKDLQGMRRVQTMRSKLSPNVRDNNQQESNNIHRNTTSASTGNVYTTNMAARNQNSRSQTRVPRQRIYLRRNVHTPSKNEKLQSESKTSIFNRNNTCSSFEVPSALWFVFILLFSVGST